MVKKKGGYVGVGFDPTPTSAPGNWLSPTEVYEAQLANSWPIAFPPSSASVLAGSYVYAVHSGVVDNLSSSLFLVANGSAVSRSTYATLFSVIGVNYGSGDGSTTFNLPNNILPQVGYQKNITLSGFNLGIYHTYGVLPTHTHTMNVATGQSSGPASYVGGPGSQCSFPTATLGSSFDGQSQLRTNEARHFDVYPLISVSSQPAPVGSLIACLPASSSGDLGVILSLMPSNCVVPTGQALSRVTYSTLFQRIGTTFGSGNGSTTFNVPDYRGLFYRAASGTFNGGVPSGYRPDTFAPHRHTVTAVVVPPGGPEYPASGARGSAVGTPATGSSSIGSGSESRPKNVSSIYLLVVSA